MNWALARTDGLCEIILDVAHSGTLFRNTDWFRLSMYAWDARSMAGRTFSLSTSRCGPVRVFLIVMVVIFVVEGTIMLLMPAVSDSTTGRILGSLIDATVLTVVTGTVVWWLAVVPVMRLFEARGELLHRMFSVQEEERARIARDLHDEVGQQLTALLVGLKTLESAQSWDVAREHAGDLRELCGVALREVRRLARGLRPSLIEDLGLEAAIRQMCEDFERTHGISVNVTIDRHGCDAWNNEVETSLYRILQEALTNVARHAGTTSATVAVQRRTNEIELSISDCGRGFRLSDVRTSSDSLTMGLAGIRERALMLGGVSDISSIPGRGTTVQVRIPIPNEQSKL